MDLARGLFAGHLTLEVASAAAIRSLMSELSALVRSAQRASCPLNGKQQRGSRRRWPRWAYRMRDARSGPAAHCRFASRRFMRPA